MTTRNRGLLAGAAVIALATFAFGVWKLMPGFASRGGSEPADSMESDIRKAVEEKFREAARLLEPQLPRRLNDEVTLVGVQAGPGPTMTYRYVLHVTVDGADLDVKARLAQNTVVAEVCRTPELRDYMDHGAWYRYIYADPEGRKVLDFEVDEAACAKREAREAGAGRESGGEGK
ncbi:MAG: GspS/AspS pilotin family protein [Desulfovibrio sp.]|nr:GspS/AspS pilotin family protein [Desulfovibrio sp.]